MVASRDGHRAVRLHRHAGRVEVAARHAAGIGRLRRPTRRLDERTEADPEIAAVGPRRPLALAKRLIADRVTRLLQRLLVAAAVIAGPERVRPGLRPDHVAQPQLDRIDVQTARDVIDQRLAHHLRRRPTDPPDRPEVTLVGHRVIGRVSDRVDVIDAGHHLPGAQRVRQRRERQRRVRPGIRDDPRPKAPKRAVIVGRDLHLAQHPLGMRRHGKVLIAILDPLHRPAHLAGHRRDERVLGEDRARQPERAAHVRRLDRHAPLRHAQRRRDEQPQQVRHL